MENETVSVDRPNSCKISVNAKGQFSGEVKAYASTLNEAMEIAMNKAVELEQFIKFKNTGE